MTDNLTRCPWPTNDPLYTKYHDEEWGVPIYDDQLLLAKLILDGAQAGLSWITILRKRENYWMAFDNFDPEKMARFDDAKIAELMNNAGIVIKGADSSDYDIGIVPAGRGQQITTSILGKMIVRIQKKNIRAGS